MTKINKKHEKYRKKISQIEFNEKSILVEPVTHINITRRNTKHHE